MKQGSHQKSLGRNAKKPAFACGSFLGLCPVVLLFCGSPVLASPQQSPVTQEAQPGLSDTTVAVVPVCEPLPGQQQAGTISGTVMDRTGAVVAGASVRLSRQDPPLSQEGESDGQGQFCFVGISPGPFLLTISSVGFASQTSSGTLGLGEKYVVPPIALIVATAVTEVKVTLTRTEEAEAEIKDEEKQRVLGVVPNFYVTYNPAAVPLNPRQKFELAWKATVDPISFGLTGAIAGIEQAADMYGGYGQGAEGYGKRYGAAYADFVTSTYIGSAILPSLFKQDPRYFYKGTGTRRSRFLYAVANAVICKGDSGHWQANYSALLGSLASGAISNLYYPRQDRHDAALTFENTLIAVGSTAATNLLQEFVIRRLTPKAPTYAPAKP
jgi:Carboxypeptidase regulatory-like domain